MDLVAVVAQLKAYVPAFEKRVAGAADFATGLESQVWQALPAAYVVPMKDEAEANDEQNGLRQVITERVGVVVEFDNSQDRRGQEVTLLYESMRTALFKALLNWRIDPDRAPRGLAYGGGELVQFDRARLFYQFDFTLQIQIDDDDGFQVGWPPLVEIDANSNPGDPWLPARVVLPQE